MLTDSMQNEYSTTTDLSVENQTTSLGGVKNDVVNPVEASPEAVIEDSQTTLLVSGGLSVLGWISAASIGFFIL